ncbi:MAG TPA: asparagine synthase-related protein, partial [Steroidobacteraceae bacterium]|nr:asparagine synthase-related protein [Steroidobacteraceae bacterium]
EFGSASASAEGFRNESSSAAASLYRRPWGIKGLDASDLFARATDGASWLAISGNPLAPATQSRAGDLLRALSAGDRGVLRDLDGWFAIAWWDADRQSLNLIRDRFGSEPLFYASTDRGLLFGSRARDLVGVGGLRKRLSAQGVVQFLSYCYLPGVDTMYEGMLRVPAGSHLQFSARDRSIRIDRWYRLSYADPVPPDEPAIEKQYRELLEQAVTRRLGGGRTGVFLSGGMDSSSAITFARRHMTDSINSFGFRCSGGSFDESHYARSLADELHAKHSEVEYGENESLSILDAIGEMEVPFCDVGIEIGTWLLSRAASGQVDYILTGDGGDEIWASHPVYAAQKLMKAYDRLPLPMLMRRGVAGMTSWVRDSDQKRNLPVVLKRLIPPPSIPRELGHFRWRTYFTRETMQNLLAGSTRQQAASYDPYQVIRTSLEGYDGPDDNISPWLYSDYTTASAFYFSRLLFARSFGVEVRTPFYDRDLVEYGARIPSFKKLEGMERTKRLFRASMEGILPDVINHRKDKLGHSVPLKNWLRTTGKLGQEVYATLTSPQMRDRGLVQPEAVTRLWDEHLARRENHSHRLWSLFVLEHWLRRRFD